MPGAGHLRADRGRRPRGPTPRWPPSGCRRGRSRARPSHSRAKSSPITTACRVNAASARKSAVYAVPATTPPTPQATAWRGSDAVEDQPGDQEREGTEHDRGGPGDGVLAGRDDVPAHRLGEQVDDRPVVDLRTEDRGGGEQGDERQGEGEAEVDAPPRSRRRRRSAAATTTASTRSTAGIRTRTTPRRRPSSAWRESRRMVGFIGSATHQVGEDALQRLVGRGELEDPDAVLARHLREAGP